MPCLCTWHLSHRCFRKWPAELLLNTHINNLRDNLSIQNRDIWLLKLNPILLLCCNSGCQEGPALDPLAAPCPARTPCQYFLYTGYTLSMQGTNWDSDRYKCSRYYYVDTSSWLHYVLGPRMQLVEDWFVPFRSLGFFWALPGFNQNWWKIHIFSSFYITMLCMSCNLLELQEWDNESVCCPKQAPVWVCWLGDHNVWGWVVQPPFL